MQFQLTTTFYFFITRVSIERRSNLQQCVMSFVFLQNQSIIITFHTDKY